MRYVNGAEYVSMWDGTVALPSLTYLLDANLGFYRIGSDNVGLSLGGVLEYDFSTTALGLGTKNLTLTGSIAITGSRVLKGWFTDLEVTNSPTVGGTALSALYQPLDANLTSIAGLSHAVGDLIYATAATTYTNLADVAVGSILVSGGVTTAPTWSTTPAITTSLTVPTLYGSSADNGDITIEGTSSATKTTSYVILQPTGGNVLIGTDSPSPAAETLEIAGSIGIKKGSDAYVETNDAYSLIFRGANGVGTVGAGLRTQYFNGSSWVNAVSISNVASGYGELLAMENGGNVLIGVAHAGTSADKVFGIGNGTAPSDSPVNMIQMWSANFLGTDTDARLHIRGESSAVGEVILGSGKETITGTTGGYTRQFSETTVNITADHTITVQTNVPSGARLLGTQLRVDAALADGETWNAQYVTGATQSIASAATVAKNTKTTTMFNTNAATDITSAEVDITIQRSSNPGVDVFTAQGTIRAIVYYEAFDTMASL